MKENIVIIGGGITGMAAAKELLLLGYNPIIIEQADHLGGHIARWHYLFPDMSPAQQLITDMKKEIRDANVFLETKVTAISRSRSTYKIELSNGVNITTQAILMATGFDLFDASKKEEYGYGIYDHVVTNADLEHWMNKHRDQRIPNNPKAIGFVHCVGSRDLKSGNNYCSKVCCTTAIKQAIEMKERFPDAEIYCFYMDLRLFGKKYEDFYINAQQDFGVHFVRGRVSEVSETINGTLSVKAEDTLLGSPLKLHLDLLVLMAGMTCNPRTQQLANMAHLAIDSDGFLKSHDNISHILDSGTQGIFYAGACTGPKTAPESIAEAQAATLKIHSYIKGL